MYMTPRPSWNSMHVRRALGHQLGSFDNNSAHSRRNLALSSPIGVFTRGYASSLISTMVATCQGGLVTRIDIKLTLGPRADLDLQSEVMVTHKRAKSALQSRETP